MCNQLFLPWRSKLELVETVEVGGPAEELDFNKLSIENIPVELGADDSMMSG